MLHLFSFPCSNPASTTTFTSPFLLHTTSSHLSGKSPTFPFSRRPFKPPALRSILPVSTSSSLQLVDINESKSMSEFYDVELKVRDYEVDRYGVVNNAVYANYCQHCGDEFLKSIGINFADVIRSGDAMAMSKLSLKFLAPLRSGDKFFVRVRISGISAARLYFDQFIYKLPNHEPVLEAKITVVRLDKNYRPVRISEDMKSKIFKYIGGDDS